MPRLVIRVNSKQSTEPDELRPSREIIEYHWHRIIAVVLVGLLLIGGVTWLTYRWLSGPAQESEQVPATAIFQQDGQASPQVELPQAESAQNKAPQQADTAVEQESQTNDALPADIATKSDSAKPVAPTRAETPTVAPTVTDSSTAANVESRPQATPGNSTPAKVVVHSKSVKRAQLTTNVVNDAPVDQLNAVVPMNEQGLLRIYLFTETSGLQDRNLFHYWYRNGKQMAKVRMPTSRKPVIASSSKFIDRYMTGQWEVKVMDDRNNLLATAHFTVTP